MSNLQHQTTTSTKTVTNSTNFDKTNVNAHSNFSKDSLDGVVQSRDGGAHREEVVKTGQYATGIEPRAAQMNSGVPMHHGIGAPVVIGQAVPVVEGHQNIITGVNTMPGPQMQNTVANARNRDGLLVNDGPGGPLGAAVMLGGQCECIRNGGSCSHGAGQCVCRGCTARATTVNPGVNTGISTAQYTAPAGTTGLGGGVGEQGTGMAGVVHSTNSTGQAANQRAHNCSCIKERGVCNCSGACTCDNCKTGSKSSVTHVAGPTGSHITSGGAGTGHYQQGASVTQHVAGPTGSSTITKTTTNTHSTR